MITNEELDRWEEDAKPPFSLPAKRKNMTLKVAFDRTRRLIEEVRYLRRLNVDAQIAINDAIHNPLRRP